MAWRFQPDVHAGSSKKASRSAWGYVASAPYARRLGQLVLAFSVLSVLCDYLFRERAGALLNEAQMASSFGALQLWNGVFSALFQLAVAEILLRRLGILRYLALVPLSLGALALMIVFVPDIWAAWTLKLVESGATLSLLPVGFQLLYGPLPDDVRDGARSAIDGFLRKGGFAVGGIALLFGARFAHGAPLAIAVLGVCAYLTWSLWQIRPRYLEMLHTRVAGASQVELAGLDERLLVQALRSSDAARALRAIDLLEAVGAPLAPHVRDLLKHPSERVRERGVLVALDLKATGVARELEGLLDDPARRPRDAAVWALPVLDPYRGKLLLPGLVDSRDIGLKTAALGAWLHLEPSAEAPQKAIDALVANAHAAEVPERRELARLLGRVGPVSQRWAQGLSKMLDDGDGSVRRIAIEAVGTGQYLELAPKLLRFLNLRDERRSAREALEALGEEVVPLVAQALDDRSRAASLRYQLPRVLRHIGTQSSFDALLFSNAHDDAFLHYRVGVAIARLKGDRPELKVDATRAR
jgi:HEAT repeat protein